MPEQTMRDVAVEFNSPDKPLIDSLLRKSPLLATGMVTEATNGLQDVSETLKDVTGAQLVGFDGYLPAVGSTTELEVRDLDILGAMISTGEDTANRMGGYANYLAKKLPPILKKTGQDTEKGIIYGAGGPRQYAIDNGNAQNAGGTTGGAETSIVAITWNEEDTTFLTDSTFFGGIDGNEENPVLFDFKQLPDSTEKDASGNEKVMHKTRMKANLALKLANPRMVSAIYNIDLTPDATTATGVKALPTELQLTQMLVDCEYDAGTIMYMHPNTLNTIATAYKGSNIQMQPMDKELNYQVATINGVMMIGSYNFKLTEAVVS